MARTSFKILLAIVLTLVLIGISVLKSTLSGNVSGDKPPAGITALKSPAADGTMISSDSVRILSDSLRLLRNYYESRMERLNQIFMAAGGGKDGLDSLRGDFSAADSDEVVMRYRAVTDTLQAVLKREERLRKDSLRTALMNEYDSLVAAIPPDYGPMDRAAAVGRLTLDLSKKYGFKLDSLPRYIKK
ncbi:hypothetical protein TRIP_C21638 [Candidatus Zixiibacteriota bacterium]|nr:hypothetical protein TRIP_C21638 [candidate division Zixibacteria bacterium]